MLTTFMHSFVALCHST